jgi:hypothetical protein
MPDIAVGWPEFVLRISDASSLILDMEAGYPDWYFPFLGQRTVKTD